MGSRACSLRIRAGVHVQKKEVLIGIIAGVQNTRKIVDTKQVGKYTINRT